ncbi:hypothetical protein ACGFYE_33400 [Streptomyces zaomyceticus]|uniref:hypothetical protein n=1 Tax=Streptomyces zaomyceticus TaxID=68286 RepID=UPI003723F23E
MLGQGWQSQWARVERRLADVQAVYDGAPGGTDAALDAAQAFFEAAFHLRDHLINDPASQVTRDDVDTFVRGSPSLKLCADIANASKHLQLTRAWTKDLSTGIERNDVTVYVGTGTSVHRFYIASGGAEHDVLQTAKGAVIAWRGFLSGRQLI